MFRVLHDQVSTRKLNAENALASELAHKRMCNTCTKYI